MTQNLWSANHPACFWQCQPEIPEEYWHTAIRMATQTLGLTPQPETVDELLELVLGEAQFGSNHWEIGRLRRIYYELKPFLPRLLTQILRQIHRPAAQSNFALGWPIEARYARFQWEVLRQITQIADLQNITFQPLWPDGHRYAFILTHDVETAGGQAFVNTVADLEELYGFRSSFNFIPERYPLDLKLLDNLRSRGFEIGVHGLKHDGKLFNSYQEFSKRAKRINAHLKALGAVGFRSPLMMRNPEWLQLLDIEYDLSFFDTDPFEPLPGGVMSIWPFIIGRFIELPYTLVQDYTLTAILRERTPDLWIQKVDFIENYQGMVLVNTHPDYLLNTVCWQIYSNFLQSMKNRVGYWHTIPRDAARWWRTRSEKMRSQFIMEVNNELENSIN